MKENTEGGQVGHISKIVFDQFVIMSRSEKREEAAACLPVRSMRDVNAECGVISKEIKKDFQEIIDED